MIRALLSTLALSLVVPLAMQAQSPTAPAPVAQAVAEIGPNIGETIPTFSAVTSAGEPVDLAAISGTDGSVLVFSRSLDWCPFCKTQANDLEEIAGDLSEVGYALNLITYDSPDILEAYGAGAGFTYTLLSDTDSAMIDGLGLRNMEVPEGSRFEGIPHPAVVFLSAEGTVEAVLREDGYRTRPSNEAILATATALSAAD